MILELEQRIISDWQSFFPSHHFPEKLSFFLKLKALHKGVGWIFDGNKAVAFFKYVNDSSVNYNIQREFLNLKALQDCLPDPFCRTVPRPFCLESINDRFFLITSFEPGLEMEFDINLCGKNRKEFEERFFSVFEWLLK